MTSREPQNSWPLVPFEQYMIDDDRPGAPMTFTVSWRLVGHVDAERMRIAIEEASRFHPLLGCRVHHGHWVPAAGGVPFQQVTAAATRQPGQESIDPLRDACLRAALVEAPGEASEAELRLTFHHAACDGVGAMEFCGDVFAAYRGTSPASQRRQTGRADPSLLVDRRHLERPSIPNATWQDTVRHFLSEGRRFLTDSAVPIPCAASLPWPEAGQQAPVLNPVPVRFTLEETAALRRHASAGDATLNELLLAILFSVIGRHCAAESRPRHRAWLGVVQPVSMRPARPTRLPACNNIGYAFLRRRLADCGDWRTLLPGVSQEARTVTRLGLAGCFNDALAVITRLPHPIRRALIRSLRPGTFVFSYLGDPLRRFPRGLRGAVTDREPWSQQVAGVDLGECRVIDFSGAPPPRPGTELAILASLFGQRLTLWLRPTAALHGSASWRRIPEAIGAAVRSLVIEDRRMDHHFAPLEDQAGCRE